MTNQDALIDCPLCEEKLACYSTKINETNNAYLCLGCGFAGNDLLIENGYDVEEFESQLPELYKVIKKVDSKGRVWYPNIVNLGIKGIVFASGTSSEDWQWFGIKNIELTEEEKQSPKFKGQQWKSDSKSLTQFGKDYLSALEYIEADI
jgi:hypothetical protein